MTTDECAAELYELVVNKGRKVHERFGSDRILGDSFAELPNWAKNEWRAAAVTFAARNIFKLDD
jgi:hypothetical protein